MSEKIIGFFLSEKFIVPIVVIIVGIVIYKIAEKILGKANIKGKNDLDKKRRNTVVILLLNIIKYSSIIIGLIIILDVYGVNTTSFIAGLGIAGVVIGLAFQEALKDIINGINIIMDDYYVVGDVIIYNNFEGTVISFGLKTTKIKSDMGEVLTVANRNISTITNLSQKKAVLYIEIPTSIESDQKVATKTIEKIIGEISKYSYVEAKESEFLGIEKINSTTINYLFKIKCNQGKEKELRRNINKKIIENYQKNNIKLKD
ncbi:MAG: mechanosensitive ion channel [Bacilli bacterium]|nr:mechanosensitive ion channel [Bacilli bacterium]MDD4406520.1 mechanosensitive ion channel [Bacilli bacterium]